MGIKIRLTRAEAEQIAKTKREQAFWLGWWRAQPSAVLRANARDRFGEVLKIDELTDEQIANEMAAYDRLMRASR